MKHTVLICGYGPAIGHAMAQRFGKEGHAVALVARSAQRLNDSVAALQAEGIRAQAFVADLSDVAAVQRTVADVRAALGTIGVLHWNAFIDVEGDLLTMLPNVLGQSLAVRVTGYVAAVQAALDDLQAVQGAVLATGGVMAFYDPEIDAFAKDFGVLAVSVAAQHKATGLLMQSLAPRGVYVGEVVVNGFVKKSACSEHQVASVAPEDVADQFWQLNATRKTHSLVLGANLSR